MDIDMNMNPIDLAPGRGECMPETVCDYETCYSVLHAMPLGVCIIDVHYTVRFWNRCLESWTSIGAGEIVGKKLGDFFPHLLEPRFTARFELLFRGGPPVIFSARMHGHLIPSVMQDGSPRLQHTVAQLLKKDGTGATSVVLTMQDVTEAHVRLSDYARMREQARHELEMRRKAEAVLRESEERFSCAFEYAANGMALVSPAGDLVKVNQALCSMLGYSGAELTGMSIRDITMPEDADMGRRKWERLVTGQANAYQEEKRFLARDGSPFWVHLSVSLVRGDDGVPLYFIAQIQNIEQRKRLEAELYALATTDSLTGINNRREFLSRADFEVQRCLRQEKRLAFLMVDIDTFKAVNDTWGHAAGDEVLKAMVSTGRTVLRVTDLFGRLGGEEFGIILTDVGREELVGIAERVRLAIEDCPVRTETATIHFTVSIGLAFMDEGLRTAEELMRRADLALYEAKSRGRNQVCVAGDTEARCLWPRAF